MRLANKLGSRLCPRSIFDTEALGLDKTISVILLASSLLASQLVPAGVSFERAVVPIQLDPQNEAIEKIKRGCTTISQGFFRHSSTFSATNQHLSLPGS